MLRNDAWRIPVSKMASQCSRAIEGRSFDLISFALQVRNPGIQVIYSWQALCTSYSSMPPHSVLQARASCTSRKDAFQTPRSSQFCHISSGIKYFYIFISFFYFYFCAVGHTRCLSGRSGLVTSRGLRMGDRIPNFEDWICTSAGRLISLWKIGISPQHDVKLSRWSSGPTLRHN